MRFFHPGKIFNILQKAGLNVTLNHFYSPIPDVAELRNRANFWKKPALLSGVDMNLKGQEQTLQKVIKPYTAELMDKVGMAPRTAPYHWQNHAFGPASAFTLYGMIRHFKSSQIIEVGSGFSTTISAWATLQNNKEGVKTKFVAIEPYPNSRLKHGLSGVSKLIQKKVEDVKPEFFEKLGKNDILFIDSSHVSKVGSDVNYLFLEILPRLKPGVIVHVHDIFFPYHYPKDWVVKSGRFWNEQYLLQAFLACNDSFRVLWSGSYFHANEEGLLKKTLPVIVGVSDRENYYSSSFWFQRVK
jgi:hypothetical protein